MGLFSKNWAKELDRAEDFLERDVPVAALEIAERAERKADPDSRARAAGVVLRARQALLTSVLAKADAAEAVGDPEDAADWLRAAIERETSPVRKSELERRIKTLLDRSGDEHAPWQAEEISVTATADESTPALDASLHSDVSFQYETLTGMLTDDVRALYEGRAPDFQQAVVVLHDGRAAEALGVLQAAAEATPTDAVARLELGRAKLFLGDAAGATDDFASAWRILGDVSLEADGATPVAALWAEAALAAGEPEDVVQRLEPLASPNSGHIGLCRLRATALMTAGHLEQAVEYLEELVSLVPSDRDLNLLFARALAESGDPARARAGLERAIDPSCSGSCASPAKHLPTFTFLARLHLLEGGDPERSRELMAWVANAQQGNLGAEEHEVLAGYYEAVGDHNAAAAAAAEAQRLAEAGSGAVAAVEVDLSPSQRRAL